MPVEIYVDQREVDKAMERLKGVPWALQKAVYPAIAETLQKARKVLAETLTDDVSLAPQEIKAAIRLRMPKRYGGDIVGDASVRSTAIPLMNYDVQPEAPTAQKGVPVKARRDFSYALRRDGKRYPGRYRSLQLIAAGWHSQAFITKMPGRSRLDVYARKGKNDYAAKLMGPTVQYHAANPEVEDAIVAAALAEFPAVLNRHVEDVLAFERARQ